MDTPQRQFVREAEIVLGFGAILHIFSFSYLQRSPDHYGDYLDLRRESATGGLDKVVQLPR